MAGHPVLTELLGTGQFFVGGSPHQYIVVERAEGAIVADMVRELAAQGERLPELEMLVIVDLLLDLLARAHQADIVYNDVDAKHLFWDRDAYRLKLIDWGNAVLLEGVVVIGYGTQKKKDLTTAVVTIDEKTIRDRPMVSAAEALQGTAAGVQVVQPSGKPGGDISVRVRGATSVLAGNEPLYIVDGVPTTDIRGLNPGDIEPMSVLKDASSAASDGARAATPPTKMARDATCANPHNA